METRDRLTKGAVVVMRVALAAAVCLTLFNVLAPAAYADDPPPGDGDGEGDGQGQGGGGGRGGAIVAAIRQIATVVIDIMIGVSVILMAVGIATGFVGGQFMVTVGQPYGLSSAWVKVISVVILGLGAILTITIVNTIIDSIASLVPQTDIPSI